MTELSVQPHRTRLARATVLAAVVAACGGIVVGSIEHAEGTMGRGGVECGSVWFVAAYHSGCQPWLDGMSRVVFVLLGISAALLLTTLVRAWRGSRLAMTLVVLVGLAIAVVGPRLWRQMVFLNFGY